MNWLGSLAPATRKTVLSALRVIDMDVAAFETTERTFLANGKLGSAANAALKGAVSATFVDHIRKGACPVSALLFVDDLDPASRHILRFHVERLKAFVMAIWGAAERERTKKEGSL